MALVVGMLFFAESLNLVKTLYIGMVIVGCIGLIAVEKTT
jgi:multidrug transporter EmrE-like cation transporter